MNGAAVRRQRNFALLPFCDQSASAQREVRASVRSLLGSQELIASMQFSPPDPLSSGRAPAEVSDHATRSPIERNVWSAVTGLNRRLPPRDCNVGCALQATEIAKAMCAECGGVDRIGQRL